LLVEAAVVLRSLVMQVVVVEVLEVIAPLGIMRSQVVAHLPKAQL
tara:strand:+ start:172 stop:306 length:135 start_codon:yes stop_codon:yes gene_type:complete